MSSPDPIVIAVCKDAKHQFSKAVADSIDLVVGQGVAGDAHAGATVQHRSRVRRDPTQPNLRQVHLIHGELIDTLRDRGFEVWPGTMGENVTTRGIDLLGLPRGALLRLGETAIVEITGLRNPCKQLDAYQDGLMNAVLDTDDNGELIRLAGIMGVVVAAGRIAAADGIAVTLPDGPRETLLPV